MLGYGAVFERIEKKYLMTEEQYQGFFDRMKDHMVANKYGEYSPASIYFDSDDFVLARRSIGGPYFKEKFRLRSYGVPKEDDPVFLEIKRKVDGVTYKRRETLPYREAMLYLNGQLTPKPSSQIFREIDRFLSFYQVKPKILIACERQAYEGIEDPEFRLTIDKDIRSRETDLDLAHGTYGTKLLPDNHYLMELKIPGAMPLWTAEALNELKIYPRGFSKYGNVYKEKLTEDSPKCSILF